MPRIYAFSFWTGSLYPRIQIMERWKFHIEGKSENAARRAVNSIAQAFDTSSTEFEYKPYIKGGYEIILNRNSIDADWSQQILSLIEQAQSISNAWQLLGNIEESIELISNKISITGFVLAQVSVERSVVQLMGSC